MRDATLKEAKATLRGFFASQDQAYLTRVVDECRAGRFAFMQHCHCLKGLCEGGYWGVAARTPECQAAESHLNRLGFFGKQPAWMSFDNYREQLRRNRTLPLVLAEIRRRTKSSAKEEAHERLPATRHLLA